MNRPVLDKTMLIINRKFPGTRTYKSKKIYFVDKLKCMS